MSDRAALITALILDRQLCSSCIAEKAQVTEERVKQILETISTALVVSAQPGRCVVCGKATRVHSVGRPEIP